MKRAAAIIRRAVSNGLVEVEVFRFSHKLCTDERPGHQSARAGLGGHADRPAEGAVLVLEGASGPARLSREVSNCGLAWRHAG